jgi:hypothetical protein
MTELLMDDNSFLTAESFNENPSVVVPVDPCPISVIVFEMFIARRWRYWKKRANISMINIPIKIVIII